MLASGVLNLSNAPACRYVKPVAQNIAKPSVHARLRSEEAAVRPTLEKGLLNGVVRTGRIFAQQLIERVQDRRGGEQIVAEGDIRPPVAVCKTDRQAPS